jgi:VanZ family protein
MIAAFVKFWVPVLLWMLMIFGGSGDLMSAQHTSRFLTPFLLWLIPNISSEMVTLIHLGIRKSAHVTEYAVFALLLCRAVFHGTKLKWTGSTFFVRMWVACVLMATCDEFRQSFVQSRDASPWDIMIDSSGAIFGLLIYAKFAGERARWQNKDVGRKKRTLFAEVDVKKVKKISRLQ